MSRVVAVVPYDPKWPVYFVELGSRLRAAIGEAACRIDHIGSTSIPGLAAKPIIDIQISVAEFQPMAPYRDPLETMGFEFRETNPELTKRYFKEPRPTEERTHIHVRRAGSFSQQFPLLFRDYMRCHPGDAAEYATLKRRLAEEYRTDPHRYTEEKGDFIWRTIRLADQWAQDTGWTPGASDA